MSIIRLCVLSTPCLTCGYCSDYGIEAGPKQRRLGRPQPALLSIPRGGWKILLPIVLFSTVPRGTGSLSLLPLFPEGSFLHEFPLPEAQGQGTGKTPQLIVQSGLKAFPPSTETICPPFGDSLQCSAINLVICVIPAMIISIGEADRKAAASVVD